MGLMIKKWRYKLLSISKRINQFISSNYFNKLFQIVTQPRHIGSCQQPILSNQNTKVIILAKDGYIKDKYTTWLQESIVLDTRLASNIINSNIVPPQQMPNLQKLHVNNEHRYNLDGTKLTKLVYQHRCNPSITNVPPTITTLTLKQSIGILDKLAIVDRTFGA
ncbi:hypothetical protein DFA_02705 [Cavenderia fasciculata]|uniref:Uncharacterized protein n=1 Tax=Cavenderia fasciculata TaxID=261658 RepID=F4Q051_CACFS|nr:uncharacterized protein DFA_02705 [Cavenderia fasciculata]EGG18965.1 hypothetical protein DFA_02705 [Cavenderia fasciculata]|eukprot:XP_004357427.1 hypothetical protein DFA_02705 [Cavenderia fasciculata]